MQISSTQCKHVAVKVSMGTLVDVSYDRGLLHVTYVADGKIYESLSYAYCVKCEEEIEERAYDEL